MNRKRIRRIIIGIILTYLVLLVLLFITESLGGAGEGRIQNLGDAAWYLLATLTTVGYGDVTPATVLGKVIGAVMMISSAGVLTFLLGLLFSLFFGRLLPRFALWRYQKRDWYVFSEINDRTVFLGERLAKDEPEKVCIYCNSYESLSQEYFSVRGRFVIIDAPVSQVLKRQGKKAAAQVFFMKDNGWDNYSEGSSILEKFDREDLRVCIETEHAPEHVAEHMVLFNRADNTARSYWLDEPVKDNEHVFLLIGNGRYAKRLLERALLINVLPDTHKLEYHTFGDWQDFKNEHYAMGQAISIDEISGEKDSVIFEKESWNASPQLIKRADRIIFCSDDHDENLREADKLFRFFATPAGVDICVNRRVDSRCREFGDDARVLSPSMVLKDRLNSTAVLLNDLYGRKVGGGVRFGELKEFQRQSNIAAADHLPVKLRLLLRGDEAVEITPENCERAYEKYAKMDAQQKEECRRLEHKRWVRFHIMNNWEYAPKRDNENRKHPMIVPFEKLSESEQALDDSAWEVLGEVKNVW
ncbi:MAG: hypothetical protein IJM34_01720 [Lachnospiraceae bacterium]|nr:hypothetical protein [Lachnospiraceae bacterium]